MVPSCGMISCAASLGLQRTARFAIWFMIAHKLKTCVNTLVGIGLGRNT